MTLFPNRFQFTSPGESKRERERATLHAMLYGMLVGCLAIGTQAFHARLRFYLSNWYSFFVAAACAYASAVVDA